MSPTLIGILASIAGLAFIAVAAWMQRGQAESTGGQLEAGKVNAAAAAAEIAIATAEAAAPATRPALVDRLKQRTF